jgi:hypothetical protein
MSELDYIGADELVFNNEVDKGIHSGGFSVQSIMMKSNMSPIMTLNNPDSIGGGNKVSDLFNDLVVPNWALSYNNRIVGGKYKEVEYDDDTESDDDVIHDDLHEKLLDLVKEHNAMTKSSKKRMTRKIQKTLTKKGGTKKKK